MAAEAPLVGLSRFVRPVACVTRKPRAPFISALPLKAPKKCEGGCSEKDDITSQAFASLAALKALGVFDGSWVKLRSATGSACRVVRMHALPSDESAGLDWLPSAPSSGEEDEPAGSCTILLAPTAFLGLAGGAMALEVPVRLELVPAPAGPPSTAPLAASGLPQASGLALAPIAAPGPPLVSPAEDGALRAYFATPRVVYANDVVTGAPALRQRGSGRVDVSVGPVRVGREEAEAAEEEAGVAEVARAWGPGAHVRSFRVLDVTTGDYGGAGVASEATALSVQAGAVPGPEPPHAPDFLLGPAPGEPEDEAVDAACGRIMEALFSSAAEAAVLPALLLLQPTDCPDADPGPLARAAARRLGLAYMEEDVLTLDPWNGPALRVNVERVLEHASDCAALLLLRGGQAVAPEDASLQLPALLRAAERAIAADPRPEARARANPRVILLACCPEAETAPAARLRAVFAAEMLLPSADDAAAARAAAALLRGPGDAEALRPDLLRGRSEAEAACVAEDAALRVARRLLAGPSEGAAAAPLAAEEAEAAAGEVVAAVAAGSIGPALVPDISWEDVGGLEEVKREVLEIIQLPRQHAELFAAGQISSAVLLFGPPGCGKTLVAKAVAACCGSSFVSVKGPELISSYVGESERGVREVFARARRAAPCVLFFDELDALAPARGRTGDSAGVMDRVVSQLLAEWDAAAPHRLVVVGATNRPDLLDPALLRPGRFDKLVYIPPPSDVAGQAAVLRALTRKFPLAPDVDLEAAVRATGHPANALTGADLYALAAAAWTAAAQQALASAPPGAPPPRVEVPQECLLAAARTLRPSVSPADLAHYARFAAMSRS